MPNIFVQTNGLYFPLGTKFWYMLVKGYPCDWSPNKNLGVESLMDFPDSISHMLSQLVAGEMGLSCVTPLGHDSWKFVPGFFQTSPLATFFFADFALFLGRKGLTRQI